ncbi:hypothetical protein [Clostridium sp.]|uniref:hypothetical protein n=1 Tax=Clostridium sp. TaxID=1506 RepID=UPI003216B120
MEGKYYISMQTPMGLEKGTIEFIVSGDRLSGSLKAKGVTSTFYGGTVNGNEFEFSGEFKKFITKIAYTAKGKIEGNNLTAIVHSKFGNFTVKGIRA